MMKNKKYMNIASINSGVAVRCNHQTLNFKPETLNIKNK